MDFLLHRPDRVVQATGARDRFDSIAAALDALRAGQSQLVVGALPFQPTDPAALFTPAEFAFAWEPGPLPPLPAVRIVDEIPNRTEHIARVTRLIKLIGDGELRKVVAARSVVVAAETPIDPATLVGRLMQRHPSANAFAVDIGGPTLVGASPELLIGKRGPRVELSPLAGTVPRQADPEADSRAAAELLASSKNLEEHSYVIDWIREQLSPVCAELSIADGPVLIGTPAVWHLGTPIRGVLRDPATTALELAALLHPTPAVGGTPTPLALATIAEYEGDRGFYGGAVGWCDATGDGDWIVAIRCAELSADRLSARAYAGGGIVGASNPEDEFDETTAKLRTFLDPFRVEA